MAPASRTKPLSGFLIEPMEGRRSEKSTVGRRSPSYIYIQLLQDFKYSHGHTAGISQPALTVL